MIMFDVIYKKTNKYYTVYHVVDAKGYPHFLVYMDNQWRYMSAKNFRPTEVDR